MNTRSLILACSLLGSVLVGGCGNDATLEAKSAHDQGKGTRQVYDATNDQAWAAAHAAIKWNENQVGVPTDHPDDHYILTDPAHFDQLGIWVEPDAAGKTRVTVVVIDDPTLPGPNEQGVQKDVGAALDLIKAGKPVDKRP
jgi:hypothetical protein